MDDDPLRFDQGFPAPSVAHHARKRAKIGGSNPAHKYAGFMDFSLPKPVRLEKGLLSPEQGAT